MRDLLRKQLWPLYIIILPRLLLGQAFGVDDEPELATQQITQEAVLEVEFAKSKSQYGLQDPRTLEVFFELFDLWIMLYRLNKADAALAEVLPACQWRRDDFTLKAIQAVAFTRWKQGRYAEALARFHEMEAWVGKNAKLCENIGHTYNAIGAFDLAEQYFLDALKLVTEEPLGDASHEGGIWLGLAGLQERRGDSITALASASQSYGLFQRLDSQRGWDSSLTAKAAMAISGLEMKLGNLTHAEVKAREALRLFELTAGTESPLVAGALHRLGAVLMKQERRVEARPVLHQAYKLEAMKDAFDLVSILEVHHLLVDAHVSESELDRLGFQKYFPTIDKVVKHVRRNLPPDGNAGAYYKAAGELLVLGGNCEDGKPLLADARNLFRGEIELDSTGLIRQCDDLIDFCDGTYAQGKQREEGALAVKGDVDPALEDSSPSSEL